MVQDVEAVLQNDVEAEPLMGETEGKLRGVHDAEGNAGNRLARLPLLSWTRTECYAFGLAPVASAVGVLLSSIALALPGWLIFSRPTEPEFTRAHLQLSPFRKCVDIAYSVEGDSGSAQGCSSLTDAIHISGLPVSFSVCPDEGDQGCKHLQQAGQCLVACLVLLFAAGIFSSYFAKTRIFSVKFRAVSLVLASLSALLANVLSLASVAVAHHAAARDFQDVEDPSLLVGAWGKPAFGAGFVLAILTVLAALTTSVGLALAKRNDASR